MAAVKMHGARISDGPLSRKQNESELMLVWPSCGRPGFPSWRCTKMLQDTAEVSLCTNSRAVL
jgi:hypothetical protein